MKKLVGFYEFAKVAIATKRNNLSSNLSTLEKHSRVVAM